MQNVIKPDLAKYQKIEEDILLKKAEFTKLRTKNEMLLLQWNNIEKKIKPFNKSSSCPVCKSTLDNTHAEKAHIEEIANLKQEQQNIKFQMGSIDELLLKEAQVSELYSKLRERKKKELNEYERATITQVELKSRIDSINIKIQDLNEKLLNNSQLVEKVFNFQSQQKKIKLDIDETLKEIELQKTVAAIYSPTGAQAYILDSTVTLFNEHIAKYVDMLWPNFTYELQSYKENVKGEVVAKFSESITVDGRPVSLGSLSGGELKALSICADMSLLAILEQQYGLYVSPVIFDEAFDGLDVSGKEFALELIRDLSKDRQVIIIDHASEMQVSFDKVLRIEKRNGISSLSS
jgi:DNA repair exonuclease SbcCD ATPase subunit